MDVPQFRAAQIAGARFAFLFPWLMRDAKIVFPPGDGYVTKVFRISW